MSSPCDRAPGRREPPATMPPGGRAAGDEGHGGDVTNLTAGPPPEREGLNLGVRRRSDAMWACGAASGVATLCREERMATKEDDRRDEVAPPPVRVAVLGG